MDENRGASAAAVGRHYDIGNEFYALWLDSSMTYSCALWSSDDETLDEAQAAKLAFHVEAAGINSSSRVLDVGCGWGSFLTMASVESGASSVEGLTLSRAQADYVRLLDLPGCTVQCRDWRNHESATGYDAVVAIGSFEHVATTGLSRSERVHEYQWFFSSCASWLRPGGRLSLQTIAFDGVDEGDWGPVADFVTAEVFAESTLPTLSEIAQASESTFSIRSIRFDGSDYARTCKTWRRRLRANKAEAVEYVDEQTVKRYLKYLGVAEMLFRQRDWQLLRITFEKR